MKALTFEQDVERVRASILRDLGKELRGDPEITVGKALSFIWDDFDAALTFMDEAKASQRVRVVDAAIESLHLYGNGGISLAAYLPALRILAKYIN